MLGKPEQRAREESRGCAPAAKAAPSGRCPKCCRCGGCSRSGTSFTSEGVKMWMSDSTACAALLMDDVPPPMKPGKAADRGLGILGDGEAAVEIVLGGNGLVDADIALVGVRRSAAADRRSCGPARRALRNWAAERVRHGDGGSHSAALRNDVAGERIADDQSGGTDAARRRVVDGRLDAGEIAGPQVRPAARR